MARLPRWSALVIVLVSNVAAQAADPISLVDFGSKSGRVVSEGSRPKGHGQRPLPSVRPRLVAQEPRHVGEPVRGQSLEAPGDVRQRGLDRRDPLSGPSVSRDRRRPVQCRRGEGARPYPGRAISDRRLAPVLPARPGLPSPHHFQRRHDGPALGVAPRRGPIRRVRIPLARAPESRDAGV